MKDLKGYVLIIGAAFFWGASATLAKFLLNQQLPTILLAQTRVTLSGIVLLGYFALFSRRSLHIQKSDLRAFVLLGTLGLAGANFFYYFTIKESTVGTAITIQYTAPLFIMAFEVWKKEERFTAAKLIAALLSLTGCFLAVTGLDVSTMRITTLGLATGVGSIVCFAFLTIATRHLVARYGALTVTFYSIVFASLFWLLLNPPWMMLEQSPSGEGWMALAILAVTSVLVPNMLFSAGLRFLVPSRAVITSTLEPVVAIATAAAFVGERLMPMQMLGAAMVIVAIVLLQLRRESPPGGELAMEQGHAAQ
jgi:drug/metabolite transporter (DMT)-like permease